MKGRNKFGYAIGFLFLGAAFVTIMGFATMYLWNWLIPEIFSGGVITFWQAIGLLILGKLLTGFSGWGHRGWGRHRGWYGGHGMNGGWKKRWEEKMEKMSPEEREKFKSYYYDRCGYKYGWMKHDQNESAQTENQPVN